MATWCKKPYVIAEIQTTQVDLLAHTLGMEVYLMHDGRVTKLYRPCKNGQDPDGYTIESFACKDDDSGLVPVPEPRISWYFHFHGKHRMSCFVSNADLFQIAAVHPVFTDLFPDLGPTQGGTSMTGMLIFHVLKLSKPDSHRSTVFGRDFVLWPDEQPMLMVCGIVGRTPFINVMWSGGL